MPNSEQSTPDFRSGFVTLVGRPNTGKSTLINALVGEKIAITSTRPQTTRRIIRGVISRPQGQLILVDTPGLHRPRTLLGERLNAIVAEAYSDVDLIACCLPANESSGSGDERIISEISGKIPLIAIVTKSDSVPRDALPKRLLEVSKLAPWKEIIPVSARKGDQIEKLCELLISYLPTGPALYPDNQVNEDDDYMVFAELIREAALEEVSDELPHSIVVVIDEIQEKNIKTIFATLFLERPSQRIIVLGPGGERLKKIGTKARREIELVTGKQVFLNLHISIEKEWQRNPRSLEKFGF